MGARKLTWNLKQRNRRGKGKVIQLQAGVAQSVGRGIALLLHDRGTRRCEWSAARTGGTLPPGKTRYPFYRRLGGPHGRLDGRKISSLSAFDPGPSSS